MVKTLAAVLVAYLYLLVSDCVGETTFVSATVYIWGAGHSFAPAQVTSTGASTTTSGDLPPSFSFAVGAEQSITFSAVSGTFGFYPGDANGPDGITFGPYY